MSARVSELILVAQLLLFIFLPAMPDDALPLI